MSLIGLIVERFEVSPDLPQFGTAWPEQIWLLFCVYPLPALIYAGHIVSLN